MQGDPPVTDADSRALDDLRERIVAVDGQMTRLLAERRDLVDQYERHRGAIIARIAPPIAPRPAQPVPPLVAPGGRERSGVLLWLGAALLAISALTFSAVAWSRLGEVGHAVLLLAATALSTALALAARRRLPMTAEAFVGLTIVLALVDVYALRRAGMGGGLTIEVWWAIGTAVVLGFAAALGRVTGRRTARFAVAALLPVPLVLLTLVGDWPVWPAAIVYAALAAALTYGMARWGGWFYSEGRVVLALHAVTGWALAALLAVTEAREADTVTGSLGPALAVAALAVAPEIAWRRYPHAPFAGLMAIIVSVLPAVVLLTLVAPLLDEQGALAASVALGGATVLATSLLPAARRTPALLAGLGLAVPGALWALTVAMPAVTGPLGWLAQPWTGTVGLRAAGALDGPRTTSTFEPSWAAVLALAAIAVVSALVVLRPHSAKHPDAWLIPAGIGCAAVAFVAALAPLNAGASVLVTLAVTTTVFVVLLLDGAYAGRRQPIRAAAPLAGAAIAAVPTLGWAAVSTGASVVTSALAAAAATGAAVIAGRAPARPAVAALAAILAVTFVGVATRAAGAAPAIAGFAVAIAAAGVTLLGVFGLGAQRATGFALECAGAATALAGTYFALESTAWLAGALTALAVAAALAALRPDRRDLYGAAAGLLALFAVWAWLSAADVTVVEAYTCPAAALMLAAGLVRWRSAAGRSWLTLGPALALAIGPTLGLGLVNDDTARLIVAALLCLAAVLAGATLRLQAPLLLGALGLVVLGVDQWGEYLVRLPRWITLGAIGVVLMWVGATFEHRRRDWRRASDVIGHFG